LDYISRLLITDVGVGGGGFWIWFQDGVFWVGQFSHVFRRPICCVCLLSVLVRHVLLLPAIDAGRYAAPHSAVAAP
jgi:hypothetical protein